MSTSVGEMGFDVDAFDRGTDPILKLLTDDQARLLTQFVADESLRSRINELAAKSNELAAKSNEGDLTAVERAEYEGYVRANKFVAILQAQARKRLSSAPKR